MPTFFNNLGTGSGATKKERKLSHVRDRRALSRYIETERHKDNEPEPSFDNDEEIDYQREYQNYLRSANLAQ